MNVSEVFATLSPQASEIVVIAQYKKNQSYRGIKGFALGVLYTDGSIRLIGKDGQFSGFANKSMFVRNSVREVTPEDMEMLKT